MYLPELNREDARLLELNAFGGINRKYNAQMGELKEAVNMSSDEYPLLKTRQGYDVGLFEPFAAMWHNNDRDMALVSGVDPDTVLYVADLIEDTKELKDGKYRMISTASETKEYEFTLSKVTIEPNQAYKFEIESGNIKEYSVEWSPSYITFVDKTVKTLPPDIHYFKNPVTANIGTSTVICDEINGMWVLEYDKDSGKYTYREVQQDFVVKNETITVDDPYSSTAGTATFISGGDACHVRLQYNETYYPTGQVFADSEEKLTEYASNAEYIGYLCRIGIGDAAIWFRLFGGGLYEPIDRIRTRICLKNAHRFRVGDYVKIDNVGMYYPYPNDESSGYFKLNEGKSELLSYINGWHEIVNVVMNDDKTGWAIDIETDMVHPTVVDVYFPQSNNRAQYYDSTQQQHVELLNDVYLADGMTIERKAPENVRFICSHMNRIWANNGDNEIMCCARGNPYVWYRYEGSSLDSWAATVGGDGAFTGCVNYGYPLFFKEGRMLRINGTRPSNFGYTEYSMKGIKEGCHDSAVIVNDILYYQGMDGIYAYGGSTPQKISDKVYRGRWTEGKACRYRDKYILCVTEGEEQSVYTFDTVNGLWHREKLNGGKVRYLYPGSFLHDHEEAVSIYTDVTESENYVTQFTTVLGRKEDVGNRDRTTLYAGYVITDEGKYDYGAEKPIEWGFETPELIDTCEYKYLKCIRIKCRPLEDGEFAVYRERDGEWRELGREITYGDKVYWYTRSFGVERTPSIRLKMSGVGKIVIDKIILEYEEGSTEH